MVLLKMKILDEFRFLAPYYDKIIRSKEPTRLIELIGLPNDGKILDAGGGTGRLAKHLVNLVKQIVIADYSLDMLKQASKKDRLFQICTPIEQLPFANHSFDVVIMIDTFHHLFEQEDAIMELWRVIKPGGKIVIEEPDIRNIFVKLLAWVEKIIFSHINYKTPEDISEMFKFTGKSSEIVLENNTASVIIEK